MLKHLHVNLSMNIHLWKQLKNLKQSQMIFYLSLLRSAYTSIVLELISQRLKRLKVQIQYSIQVFTEKHIIFCATLGV